MKWCSAYRNPQGWRFIIEDDTAGFYLYVYEMEESFEDDMHELDSCSHHHQDHLQDTLEQAQGFALRKFNVPLESWVNIEA